MITIEKIKTKLYKRIILYFLWKTNPPKYMKKFCKYLRKLGVNAGNLSYVDLSIWLDCVDYSLITIEDGVVLSREVVILVHDFSISNGIFAIGKKLKQPCNVCRKVHIGKNSFIGLRTTILPGTTIGENCIIGAGSVVRGEVEPYSIMIGNPAVKVGDVRMWINKKIDKSQYIKDCIEL